MESKKINQLATELAPELSDLTIIGDPTTGISKKITLSQMASLFTGTVEEYANLASFPLVGAADTIYIALDTNIIYRWNTGTSAYVELSPNIVTSLVFNDANGFDGTISLVGSTATLTITTALTTGSVGFIGASGALTQDNTNFFWDNSNKRLGINTNTPTGALDVFGSGIIGRLNGTSTNNAFLGFSSAGSNKWSIGNVQSDHRFRIYNEATTSELVSVLQTGEFGIGIANPTTKFHIDGGASALIANLDANVSVAKSISFRSDNSARINLEVSGTESGSNAGANFFLRTYTDAGALLETPFSIVRSTGVTTIKSLTLTNALPISSGGTGSTIQNFVDLTTTQTIAGAKTFSNAAIFSSTITAAALSRIGDVFIGGRSGTYASYPDGIIADNLHLAATATGGAVYINSALSRSFIVNPVGGNVSIGTSTPYSESGYTTLTINNASTFGGVIAFQAASTNYAYVYGDVSGLRLESVGALNMRFFTNSTERMRITSGGNVGIGTNSPDYPLTVQANSGANALKLLGRSLDNISIMSFMNNANSTEYGYIAGISSEFRLNANGALPITLFTNGSERMRITSGGYLKASNNGTYDSSTGSYHEFSQNSISTVGLRVIASNSGYYDAVQQTMCVRTNNSAYSLHTFYSNNFADMEFNLRGDGQAYADGSWNGGGADYAEYFEWLDGNSNNEDRRGYSVSLVGNKIKIAQKGETIIGVISGNPSVIGDSAWNMWTEKYLRDDFGTYVRDENGDRVLNPNYNPDIEYIPREQRPEWGIVGLMGKLCIRKGQEVMPNWVKMKDISDNVEQWLIK